MIENGIFCIGRMGGDGWIAQVHFDEAEATIVRRGKGGTYVGPIATVPLGTLEGDPDDDESPTLVDDEQNRNLLAIVFCKEMERVLREVEKRLAEREEWAPRSDAEMQWWRKDMELLTDARDVLATLDVETLNE